MVIKIETKKVGIPVEIGALNFVVGTSDKELEGYVLSHAEVVEAFNKVEAADKLTDLHPALEKGYDVLLGDGAFKQIYEQTPSTLECAKYLTALYEGVFEELEALSEVNSQENKAKKYKKTKKDFEKLHKKNYTE